MQRNLLQKTSKADRGHLLVLVDLFVLKCVALLCFLGSGLSHVLTLVLQELSLLCKRDVNGVGVLYDLLRSRWLQALLKVKQYSALKINVSR